MKSKALGLSLALILASLLPMKAALVVDSALSYDSETAEATLNDPDTIYTGMGDQRQQLPLPPPGTSAISTSLTGTSASTGDTVSAEATYTTTYLQGSESLILSGTGTASFSASADTSHSLFGDAADATQVTFTPDQALDVSANVEGDGSILDLYDSTTSAFVLYLVPKMGTPSPSASAVLVPGDDYIFGTYVTVGLHEPAASPAFSNTVDFSYSFEATPEPSTYALGALGLGFLALLLRKSRSSFA